jgi:hypothetical protein
VADAAQPSADNDVKLDEEICYIRANPTGRPGVVEQVIPNVERIYRYGTEYSTAISFRLYIKEGINAPTWVDITDANNYRITWKSDEVTFTHNNLSLSTDKLKEVAPKESIWARIERKWTDGEFYPIDEVKIDIIESPYAIDLDEDFHAFHLSAMDVANTELMPAINLSVYNGTKIISLANTHVRFSTEAENLMADDELVIVLNNIEKVDPNADGYVKTNNNEQLNLIYGHYRFTNATIANGTIKFIYKQKNEELAHATFTAIRSRDGANGTPGAPGANAYTLSLSNDMDVVAYNNAGQPVSSFPVTTTATRHFGGGSVDAGDEDGGLGTITLECKSEGWTQRVDGVGDWSYDDASDTLTIYSCPRDGEFLFSWIEDGVTYDSETFTIRRIESNVDYDLVIPQTVFNTSVAGGTIGISVLKKSSTTTTLTAPDNDISIYRNSVDDNNLITDWSAERYEKNQTTPIKYILTSKDKMITWDEESVEFV